MIRIGAPFIEIGRDFVYVKSHIVDDIQQKDMIVWYRSDLEYGKYFNDDVLDAFVLPMVLCGIKYQEDIEVDGYISEKLFYNIRNNLVYTLSIPFHPRQLIDVRCKGTKVVNYRPTAVGCGCSLGVDSFSAMLRHMSDDCPVGYRITHLTNFNIGAYGNEFEKGHKSFLKALETVREFSEKEGMPLVLIESNFGDFFKGLTFNWSGPVRTMSTALSMQKLFHRYYYASGHANIDFEITDIMGHFASLVIPMLSTENIEFIVADQDRSRVDKTAAIADNPLAQKYLHVCLREIRANNQGKEYLRDVKYRNCTRCDKCWRTLITLDILGVTEMYREIFDVDYFYSIKNSIIEDVLMNRRNNLFKNEIYQLMIEKNYQIPPALLRRIKAKRVVNKIKNVFGR